MDGKIIIVGAGAAAVNAIKAIREVDKKSEIIVFGKEKFYPYIRIRLTKSMFENLLEDKILLQKPDWYKINNVDVHLEQYVKEIDTKNYKVVLDNGTMYSYKKLLLASGAHNFKLPIDGVERPGVYSIRSIEDIKSLQDYLEQSEKVLNIGGGIQGLETAWILHQHNKKVAIAEFQDRLMPRQLDVRASEILKEAIENLNIEVNLNTQVKSIVGEDKVEGVLTNLGHNLKCDMVIYSVGIRPNIEFLQDSNINLNNGVLVNDRMETNVQGIYAAGDIAEFNGKINGTWSAAVEQGKIAGYNLSGKEARYVGIVPMTTLSAFNISLFSIGNVDEKMCDYALIDDKASSADYKRIFIKNNHIIGAIVMGDATKSVMLKSCIEKKVDVSQFDVKSMSASDLINEIKKFL